MAAVKDDDLLRMWTSGAGRHYEIPLLDTLRAIARAAAEEAALLALGIGQTMHEGTKYAEGYEDGAKDAARAIVLGAVQPAVCDHREVDRADAILDTLRTRSQGQGGGNG
jgi:hypothetical protein